MTDKKNSLGFQQEKPRSISQKIEQVDQYMKIEKKIVELRKQQIALGLPINNQEQQQQKSEILLNLCENAISENQPQDAIQYFEESLQHPTENNHKKLEILTKLANVYIRTEYFEQVTQLFETVIASQKGKTEQAQNLHNLGKLYLRTERYQEAIIHLENALTILPKNSMGNCVNELAHCYNLSGDKDKTMRLLEKFDNPLNTQQESLIKFNLGKLNLYHKNNPQKAILCFQEFIEITNKLELKIEALIKLAHAYQGLQEADKAIQSLIEAKKQCKNLEEENIILIAELLDKIGRTFYDLKQHQDCAKCFQEILSLLSEESGDEVENLKTWSLYHLGIIASSENQLQDSIGYFEETLKYCAQDDQDGKSEIFYSLADVYAKIEDFDNVEQCINKALASQTDKTVQTRMMCDFGKLYYHANKFQKAIVHLKNALTETPKSLIGSCANDLASCYYMLGNKDKAISLLEEFDTPHNTKQEPLIKLNLGKWNLSSHKNNPQKAIPYFQEFIEITNDLNLRIDAFISLAYAYEELQERDKAIQYSVEARKQCEGLEEEKPILRAKLLNEIGKISYQLGQHQDASNCFQEALSLLAKENGNEVENLKTEIRHFVTKKGFSIISEEQKKQIANLVQEGEALLSAEKPKEAIPLYLATLDIAQSTNEQQAARHLFADLGWAYFLSGEIATALEYYKFVVPEDPNFIKDSQSLLFPSFDYDFLKKESVSPQEKQEMEKFGKTDNTVFFDRLEKHLDFQEIISNRIPQAYSTHLSVLEELAGETKENKQLSQIKDLVRTGLVYLENSKYKSAVEYLEKALFDFKFTEETIQNPLYIAFILSNLGKAQAKLSNDTEAIKNLEKALAINTEQKNTTDKCDNLLSLSELHGKQANFAEEISCLKELLEKVEKEKSLPGQIQYLRQLFEKQYSSADIAYILTKLGNAYCNCQNWEETQKYYQQAQEIYAKEEYTEQAKVESVQTVLDLHKTIIVDKQRTGNAQWHGANLDKLRKAHQNLGNIHAAIECATQLLDTSQKNGNKQDQISDMKNLGILYIGLQAEDKAQELFEKALELSRDMNNSHAEINLLMELSRLNTLENMDERIELKQEALTICENNQDFKQQASVLLNLGNTYFQQRDIEQAIESYEKALFLFRENDDQTGEEVVLNGMKKVFFYLHTEDSIWQEISGQNFSKKTDDSIKENFFNNCESGLLKSQIEANPKMEIICLKKLGEASLKIGEIKQANQHYQVILPVSREIGDQESEEQANTLLSCNNLLSDLQEGNTEQTTNRSDYITTGDIYFEFGLMQPAIECYEYVLSFDPENFEILKKLATAYDDYETFDRQKEEQYSLQLLKISEKKGEKSNQLICLERLGKLENWSNPEKASQYNAAALALSQELQNQTKECKLLFELGENNKSLEQYSKALECFKQAINLSKKIGDVNTEIDSLFHLAQCHTLLNQNPEALRYFAQIIWRNTKVGDINSNSCFYEELKRLFVEFSQTEPEILHCQKLLEICQKMKNKEAEAMILIRLGKVYKSLGQLEQAIKCYENGLNQTNKKPENRIFGDIFSDYANALRNNGETEKADHYSEKADKVRNTDNSQYYTKIGLSNAISTLKRLCNTEEVQATNEKLKDALSFCKTEESKTLQDQIQAILEHNEKLLIIWDDLENKDYSKLKFTKREVFKLAEFYLENDIIKPALKCYEYLLHSESEVDSFDQSELYYNLGVCYSTDSTKEKEATTFFKNTLQNARKNENKDLMSRALSQLAQKHWKENQPEEAIKHLKKSLYLAQESKNTEQIYGTYGNLAQLYSALLNSDQAVKCYKTRLKIAKKNCDDAEIVNNLYDLGKEYSAMQNWPKAVKYFKKQIKTSVLKDEQKINAYATLGETYSNWSRNSKWEKKIKQRKDKAEEYFLEQLLAAIALADKEQEASAFSNLAIVQEENEQKIEYLIQACTCSNEIEKNSEALKKADQKAHYLDLLGTAYYEIEDLENAFKCYQEAYQRNKQSFLSENEYTTASHKINNLVNLIKICLKIDNTKEIKYVQEILDLLKGYPFNIEINGFISDINELYCNDEVEAEKIITYIQEMLIAFENYSEDMKAADLTLDVT